ncbi:MAG: phosphate acyltransferase PlsX [Gammaproteobacteria bacterium]|nr:phosphate acyltransferase PlsX [Gammaproteobacteria bacterium]
MSGDKGLESSIPAIKLVMAQAPNINIILVGNEPEIKQALSKYEIDQNLVAISHATEIVSMTDSPASALRYKKDSSMRKAIDLLKRGEADACVSSGNTGALMAISKFVLKTIDGIERPAIASAIPTRKGRSLLLDLGANINCTSNNLYQFALMGSILAKSINLSNSNPDFEPKVALLNVGEEALKGTETIKEAAVLISHNKNINYIGFVEGNNLYNDVADVIVCDGFAGNVALKTSEGLSRFISDIFKQSFNKNIYTKVMGILTKPIAKDIRNKLDSRNYNGASLLGLNGIVIKSHGSADSRAFANAIIKAKKEIETNIIGKLKDQSSLFQSVIV